MANITNNSAVFVVLNGPTSMLYRNSRFPGPLFGCNFAYRHFDLQYCCAVDLKTIRIVEAEAPGGIQLMSKRYPGIGVRWQQKIIPGIDSGSFAIEQALIRFGSRPIYVIGADGILQQQHKTVYEYEWRGGRDPHPRTHQRHRQTVLKLIDRYRPKRLWFVNDSNDQQLRTITHENFVRTGRVAMDAKRFEHSEE